MCGRYALATPQSKLVEVFDVPVPAFPSVPRYNIAPGQPAPVVAEDGRGRRVGRLTWGYVPGWRDNTGRPLINARSESVADKPAFRESFDRRRCLVPADGFYEWNRDDGSKRPFWIHPSDGGLLSLAGIWTRWAGPDGEARHGFAILTMAASGPVATVHHRMPVVIDRPHHDAWLDRATGGRAALDIVRRSPVPAYESWPVSTRVNDVSEDGPGLIEAVPDEAT